MKSTTTNRETMAIAITRTRMGVYKRRVRLLLAAVGEVVTVVEVVMMDVEVVVVEMLLAVNKTKLLSVLFPTALDATTVIAYSSPG